MKENKSIYKRCIYRMLCSMVLMLAVVSCAGKKDSLIVRENPGPGADSYREASEADGAKAGSGGGDNAGSGRADSLAERLQVPALYEKSIQSEDGTFQLTCNAETVVPDVPQIPIYQVGRRQVDQTWIDSITDAFFGKHPVYDGNAYIPDPRIYGNDMENPMEKKEIHPGEGQANPSESAEYVPSDFYGIVEMEDGIFSYMMTPTYGSGRNIQILRKKAEALNEVLYWDSGYYASEETTTYPRPSKEEAERIAGITPEEAQETAKEYLKKLELDDFAPRYTALSVCYYYTGGIGSLETARFIDTGYLVSCTREVAGIPITEERMDGNWFEAGLDELPGWEYEKVQFFINQEGLQEARISNLYRIEEQQAANVELLTFPEIADIFEQVMRMDYENPDVSHIDVRIDRIQLGYMRIYNPGVDNTSGILVPVWDFFGSLESYESMENGEYGSTWKRAEPNDSLLTINACDGTVIDRQLGY